MRASVRMTRYLESWGAAKPFANLHHRDSMTTDNGKINTTVGVSSREEDMANTHTHTHTLEMNNAKPLLDKGGEAQRTGGSTTNRIPLLLQTPPVSIFVLKPN